MTLSIWPKPNLFARLRLITLLGILAAVIVGTVDFKQVAGEAGNAALRIGLAVTTGRFFEGITSKPTPAPPSRERNRELGRKRGTD